MKKLQIFKTILITSTIAISGCSNIQSVENTEQIQKPNNTISSPTNTAITTGSIDLFNKTFDEMPQNQFMLLPKTVQNIFFNHDESTLSIQAMEELNHHAQYLIANPTIKTLIEGHTDNTGTQEYNIALGERRAQIVKKYLIGVGVQHSQINHVSYGEEKPLDTSGTAEANEVNRRAHINY